MPRDWGTVKRKPPQVVKVDPAIPSKIVYPPRLRSRGTEGLLKESHHRSSRSTRPSRPIVCPPWLWCRGTVKRKPPQIVKVDPAIPPKIVCPPRLRCRGTEGPLKESHHICLNVLKFACYFRKLKIYTVAFIKIYLFRLTQIIYIKYHNNCQICLLNS